MTEVDSMISTIFNAIDDKKGFDIKILKISKLTTIADYFIICSGNSNRQVQAIADEIDDKMSKNEYELKNREGYKSGDWVILDYGYVITHIFHKESREFYNLERLWIDAENINIDNII